MHRDILHIGKKIVTIKKHEIIDTDDLYEYKEEMLAKEMLKK